MERTLFEHAAVRYQNMVYRIALHYFGNSQDAEDAVQEVFLRLYTAEKSFESPEHLRRWLIRVTVNVCRDVLRSPWRRRRSLWRNCRKSRSLTSRSRRRCIGRLWRCRRNTEQC